MPRFVPVHESGTSLFLAGAEGFEPPSPVLETGSLAVELTPLFIAFRSSPFAFRQDRPKREAISKRRKAVLFCLFMWRVLPALPAELLEFQPARRRLLVLGGGVVTVLALSTLQRHNLAGHGYLPFRLPRSLNCEALSAPSADISKSSQLTYRENL